MRAHTHASIGTGRLYSAAILGTWKSAWQTRFTPPARQFAIDDTVIPPRVRVITRIASPIPYHRQSGLAYIAVLEEDEDDGFVATIPALRGCISQGDSQDEALTHLKDALKGWIEVAQRHGLQIPLPDGTPTQ